MDSMEILYKLQKRQIDPEKAEEELRLLCQPGKFAAGSPSAGVKAVENPPADKGYKSRVKKEPVAVVGISGRYPGASDLYQFWDNLIHARNSIREIPFSRWDMSRYYDPRPHQKGKIYCKWMGMLDDIDCFDPLFFMISPGEAELMDPQQRLFLQEGYHAFEDAGYTRRYLNKKKCGVYLGIMNNEYNFVLHKNGAASESITGNSYAIAAARIPYYLNLKGPAIPVDTACSSALTGVHLACQALLNDEIDIALTGGVTLYLTPESYMGMCGAGMLSPDGQCKTFDNDADGFVPGEGASAVVLKRLSDAQADNDNIYGLIVGSGINQDGKTNGITAPSVQSQAELERWVYSRYNINPETISYVEMHGTGTKLGDPVELEALSSVFKEWTNKKNFCAIGSVKTNIGHTSAAAGLASIHKVLLSLRYKQLVPSLNFKDHNEHFNFSDSPFYVNTELKSWESEPGVPRRACVSAFGFSGTNAHIVLEEYLPERSVFSQPMEIKLKEETVLFFSARNAEQLRIYVSHMLRFLDTQKEIDLYDLAYTLQTGREHMAERMALVVSDLQEAKRRLKKFHLGESDIPGVYTGNLKSGRDISRLITGGESGKEFLTLLIKNKELDRLAQIWAEGADIEEALLFGGRRVRRIPLPTYPFERKRYWIEENSRKTGFNDRNIHPFVDRMVPLINTQGLIFEKRLNNSLSVLKEHKIGGISVFPGAGYLEMIAAAVSQIKDIESYKISDVVYLKPLSVSEDDVTVWTSIKKTGDKIKFDISSSPGKESLVHVKGAISLTGRKKINKAIAVEDVRRRCLKHVTKSQIYDKFKDSGINYGQYFQTLEELWYSDKEALGVLRLSGEYRKELDLYTFHPSLTDGAIQAAGWCMDKTDSNKDVSLLFSIDDIEIFQNGNNLEYSYVQKIEKDKFQIYILDHDGFICIKFSGVVTKAVQGLKKNITYYPTWEVLGDIDLFSAGKLSEKRINRNVLIVYSAGSEELKEALSNIYGVDRVTGIKVGKENKKHADGNFEVRRGDSGGFDLSGIKFHEIEEVYFLSGLDVKFRDEDDFEAFKEMEENSIFSLFRMIKTFYNRGMKNFPVRFNIITNGVFNILPGDCLNPYAAGMRGFLKSLSNENDNFFINYIDVSFESTSEKDAFIPVAALCRSFAKKVFSTAERYNEIALRQNRVYRQKISSLSLPEKTDCPFKENGVYIILGGMGNIGIEVCEYLSRQFKAKLVLIGRSELDSGKKQLIKGIESKGGRVLYLRADVTDPISMHNALNKIKIEFKHINGVIHSAMVTKPTLVEEMTEDDLRSVYNPKALGSLVLFNTFKNEPLDFLVFFSSVQSFVGDKRFSNYAAGISFEDSFGVYADRKVPFPVKVINWGYWKTGPYLSEKNNKHLNIMGYQAIEVEEGIKVLEHALCSPLVHLIVLKADEDILLRVGIDADTTIICSSQKAYPVTDNEIFFSDREELNDFQNLARGMDGFFKVEVFSRELLLNVFRKLGIFLRAGEKYKEEELLNHLKIDSGYYRLFDELLGILERLGYVHLEDGIIFSDKSIKWDASGAAEQYLKKEKEALLAEHGDMYSHINLVWECYSHIPEILTGQIPATDIMFPHASTDLVEGIYKGNIIADYLNTLIVKAVERYVKSIIPELRDGEKIRILELGAGTGGTSLPVFESINKYNGSICYVYTDISKSLVEFGKTEYGREYSFVEFKVLDVEKNIESQGYTAGDYDIVIAANIIHATENIRETLRSAKTLIKQGGWLLLNEATGIMDYLTLTFGLLDGWWKYTDEEVRIKGSPLVSAESWSLILKEEGFKQVVLTGLPEGASEYSLSQHVIIAESDGLIKKKTENTMRKNDTEKPPEKMEKETQPLSLAPEASFSQGNSEPDMGLFVENAIKQNLSEILKIDIGDFDNSTAYSEYGVDSILAVMIAEKLNETLKIDLRTTDLFNYSDIQKLKEHILDKFQNSIVLSSVEDETIENNIVENENKEEYLPSDLFTEEEDLDILNLFKKIENGELDIDEQEKILEKL